MFAFLSLQYAMLQHTRYSRAASRDTARTMGLPVLGWLAPMERNDIPAGVRQSVYLG